MRLKQIGVFVVVALAGATSAFAQCGQIPAAGQVALRALAAKFPEQVRSQNDDDRRAWAMKAAQQLAFSISPEFGTKRAGNGRPTTKDSVARVISGRLCNWDLVNGSSRELTFGNGVDITGQVFVSVQPADFLGSPAPTPTPTPTPTTQPGPEFPGVATADLQQQQIALLTEIVLTLKAQNVALVQAVNELKAQVADGLKIKF